MYHYRRSSVYQTGACVGVPPKTDLAFPYGQVDSSRGKLPGKDTKIVLCCRSGRMSGIAARRLVGVCCARVTDLTGGMLAWEASRR